MFGRKNERLQEQAAEFATRADFEKIFTEEMDGLHLLSLLLTADETLAEQAFVAGLEDSIHSNPVFRQWARSWSKRAIIKNAIKLISPLAPMNNMNEDGLNEDGAKGDGLKEDRGKEDRAKEGGYKPVPLQPNTGDSQADALISCVTRLEPLQRFVFVMAILEGHSTTECAALLSCSPQQILAAKAEVLKHIGSRPCSQAHVPPKYGILAAGLMARAQVA